MKKLLLILSVLMIGNVLWTHSIAISEPNTDRHYVKKDPKLCKTIQLKCAKDQTPFTDDTGCGCQKNSIAIPARYQALEVKDAGITIEYPKNWIPQGKDTAWSPNKTGIPLLGFQWQAIASDWEPAHMLPKNSDSVGPFMIDLGWERGLLYFVQIKADKDHSTDQFEIHAIVPRMEAEIAYDFYARAHSLSQLKDIEMVTQKLMQSGVLNRIKLYVSDDPEECKEISIDCNINEEEFSDKKGCGCLINPQTEAVYDN